MSRIYINLSISPSTNDKLEELARRNGISKSAIVDRIVMALDYTRFSRAMAKHHAIHLNFYKETLEMLEKTEIQKDLSRNSLLELQNE